MEAAVFGLLGVALGGLITGFVTIRAEQLRTERETALDSARRQDDRKIERDRFQLATLQAVQLALGEWIRTRTEMYHADKAAMRATGRVANPYPNDLGERERVAAREFMYLVERIRDDDLRESLRTLRHSTVKTIMATTEDEVEAAFNRTGDMALAALDQLGVVLRSYL